MARQLCGLSETRCFMDHQQNKNPEGEPVIMERQPWINKPAVLQILRESQSSSLLVIRVF